MNKIHNRDTFKKVSTAISLISIGSLILLAGCNSSRVSSSASNSPTSSPIAQASSDVSPSTAGLPSPQGVPVDPESNNVLDDQLIIKFAQDNLFEIQANQLAQQKASSSAVKQFAQRMVHDHTQATAKLQQVASARNVTLPTDMGGQNRAMFDRLSGLSGRDFDREFATIMVNSHRQDVALLQNQAQRGQDQQLKTQASQYLPALQGHLQLAENLLQQVGE
ncbi:MAG TPA: DUF4142 domain-containing protein [Crinalium sp.]